MASLLWAEWIDQHVLSHVSSILFPDEGQDEVVSWSDELLGTTTPLHRDNGMILQNYRSVIRHVASKKVPEEPGLVIVSALLQLPPQKQPQNGSSHNNNHNNSTAANVAVTELLQFCVVDDQLHLTWDDPRWNWWLVLPQRQHEENQPSPSDERSSSGGGGVVALFSYGKVWINHWSTRLGLLRFVASRHADQEPKDTTSAAFH